MEVGYPAAGGIAGPSSDPAVAAPPSTAPAASAAAAAAAATDNPAGVTPSIEPGGPDASAALGNGTAVAPSSGIPHLASGAAQAACDGPSDDTDPHGRLHERLTYGAAGDYWKADLGFTRKRKAVSSFAADPSMIASSERRIVARVRHDWAQEQQGGQRAHGLWRGICVQVTDKIVDGTTMWYPANVIDVEAARVLVHFRQWSSMYDRWIAVEDIPTSIRLATPTTEVVTVVAEGEADAVASDEADDECICGTDRGEHVAWIQCEECDEWYHMDCVGVTSKIESEWDLAGVGYSCPKCMPPYGLPSKMKKPPPQPEPEPEPKVAVELTGNAGVDNALAALAALAAASSAPSASDGPPVKRGRGRPPKSAEEKALTLARRRAKNELLKLEKKKLKGQQKAAKFASLSGPGPPKKRGRPPKVQAPPVLAKDECKTCTRNWHTAHTCGRGRTDNPLSQKHRTVFPFAAAPPPAKPKSHHKKPVVVSLPRSPSGADRTLAAGSSGKVDRPKKSDKPSLPKLASPVKKVIKVKPKWFRCDFCKKRFKSLSLQKEHKRVHELEWESQAIEQRLMRMRQGKLRGLNKKFTNRRLVLVASPLSYEGGTGYEFQLKTPGSCDAMMKLLEQYPVVAKPPKGHEDAPSKIPFVYTNVRAQEGGVEGRAYHLNQGSIPKFLEEPAVQSLLAEAGTGQLGKLGVDFKIDSIDVLKQTHSSWFERHIDTHSEGSLDFAIICLLRVDDLADGAQEATGCGVELFPLAKVHDESMNLVAGQPLGDPVTLYMQKPGDCAVFPGRWVYHRSIHTNTVGIRGVLHKIVFFGYFLENIAVPVSPLISSAIR